MSELTLDNIIEFRKENQTIYNTYEPFKANKVLPESIVSGATDLSKRNILIHVKTASSFSNYYKTVKITFQQIFLEGNDLTILKEGIVTGYQEYNYENEEYKEVGFINGGVTVMYDCNELLLGKIMKSSEIFNSSQKINISSPIEYTNNIYEKKKLRSFDFYVKKLLLIYGDISNNNNLVPLSAEVIKKENDKIK